MQDCFEDKIMHRKHLVWGLEDSNWWLTIPGMIKIPMRSFCWHFCLILEYSILHWNYLLNVPLSQALKEWDLLFWVFCSNPHCLAQSQAYTDDFGIELDSSKHLPGPQPGLLLTLDVTITRPLSLIGLQTSLLASCIYQDWRVTVQTRALSQPTPSCGMNSFEAGPYDTAPSRQHQAVPSEVSSAPWPLVHWPLGDLHWNYDFAISFFLPLWVRTDVQQCFSAL